MLAKVSNGHALVAAFALLLGCGLLTGCRMENGRPAYAIPGPTVPSEVPTQAPYVWDSREELEVWTNNDVSHGPVSLEGNGREAVVRIATGSGEWVLRGPDLDPPARSVRTVRVRVRWTQGRETKQPSSVSIGTGFQPPGNSAGQYGGDISNIRASTEWAEVQLERRASQAPFDVRYAYLYDSRSEDTGVLEIDRIELVRQMEP